jgi:hypothetical protein
MHQRTILSALELFITLGLIYALCLSITYGQTEVSLKLINLILCMNEYIKVKNQNQFMILEMFLALALLP